MTERADAVVIGGGPVGAAAALELSAAGFSVLLMEAREALEPPRDARPLALSYGSRLILERLGVWPAVEMATPIERIHVSHRGRFGRAVLTAAEAGLPALGYVLDYASVLSALDAAVDEALSDGGLRVLRGARVTSIAHDSRSARIAFEAADGSGECYASVVAVADGTADALDIPVRVVEYGQSAVSARVEVDRGHARTAYERFTPEGPLALLPYGGSYAVVWTTTRERAQPLCDAAPEAFLAELQERFGERAGRFTAVSARAAHPVALRVAQRTTSGRAALVGNSAQALHPVAGQGLNVGLRDAWELATEIRTRGAADDGLLQAYRARRRIDRGGGVAFTHALVTIFSNDWLPLALARGAGLTLLDCVPPAKNFVARRMIFGARGLMF
jgi:2-octaprenyl-6-methoxyphenol hydroxylase